MALFARTTQVGSRNLIHACLAGTQEEMQGKYINVCKVEEESDFVLSKEGGRVAERLWKETMDVLGEVDPRTQDILRDELKHL